MNLLLGHPRGKEDPLQVYLCTHYFSEFNNNYYAMQIFMSILNFNAGFIPGDPAGLSSNKEDPPRPLTRSRVKLGNIGGGGQLGENNSQFF